jgi:hypothetical protein
MLNQIGKTVGSMGEAYEPINKALTKPQGDMNDPAHLRNLAQWASQNGDATSAASYMAEARRIADQATADAKQLRKEQGNAAMGNIQLGMQQVLAQGGPDVEKRMQALEQAAVSTAGRYAMDANEAAGMGDAARMRQLNVEGAQRNAEIQQRAQEDLALTDELNGIRQSGKPREEQDKLIDVAIKRATANGSGASAARKWQAADVAFDNSIREANEAAAKSGPLSDDEIARAEEFGISVEGNIPSAVRSSIRSVEVARASQKRDKVHDKPVEKSIIRELLPQAMADMESDNMVIDTQLDDWLEDAVDDPELMDRVAAFIDAGATVEHGPQAYNQLLSAIKDYVVATDSGKGLFSSAKEEILEERGVTTVTTSSGETVTIKKKED